MANQMMLDKIREMMAAPSCCEELKEAAQVYLDAVDTKEQKKAAARLIEELNEDVSTIEEVIAFFGSDVAKGIFGPEQAVKMLAHAKDVRSAGGKYCDCAACTKGKEILDQKELL